MGLESVELTEREPGESCVVSKPLMLEQEAPGSQGLTDSNTSQGAEHTKEVEGVVDATTTTRETS